MAQFDKTVIKNQRFQEKYDLLCEIPRESERLLFKGK